MTSPKVEHCKLIVLDNKEVFLIRTNVNALETYTSIYINMYLVQQNDYGVVLQTNMSSHSRIVYMFLVFLGMIQRFLGIFKITLSTRNYN